MMEILAVLVIDLAFDCEEKHIFLVSFHKVGEPEPPNSCNNSYFCAIQVTAGL